MDEQRVVYVGLSRHHKWWAIGSFLIRWWEHPKNWNPASWFGLFHSSHVFMIFPANKRRDFYMVSEAAGSSVRFMSEMNFVKHAKITKLYELRFPKSVYDKMKTYSEQYAGNQYATWENIGIVIAKILKKAVNPFDDGDRSQKCSELVFRNCLIRIPGMTFEELRRITFDARAVQLPTDIDLLGVRDTFETLECLVDAGKASRLPMDWHCKIYLTSAREENKL